ncbi:hypothetical protein ILYODFUR_019604 [Ilyodon furcidens]|uniref:Dynein heavy chain tail domain-containing protein n=1 Tax=Ilyodon furcidens TaxID=33524 RepID=A0ABV0SZI5_9TELE
MLMISNYQANIYLGPEEVLKGETAESLLRVKTSLEVLQLFRSTYEDHRANLRKYQKNGTMVKPWDFSTLLVFSRLDQFIKRLQNIKDILSTSLDLMKLEKLEIGGIRGRALSLQIKLLYQEFLESYKFFTDKPYDCLDITNMVSVPAFYAGYVHISAGQLECCLSKATLGSIHFPKKLGATTLTVDNATAACSLDFCGAN